MSIKNIYLIIFVLLSNTAYADQVPVSSAPSFQLTTSNDTCMGSSTAGAQGALFGFSIGSAWTDRNCVRIKLARELQDRGFKTASLGLLCKDAEVREEMKNAGTPCPTINTEPVHKNIVYQYPTVHR